MAIGKICCQTIPTLPRNPRTWAHKRIPNNLNYLTMHILLKCTHREEGGRGNWYCGVPLQAETLLVKIQQDALKSNLG